MMKQKLLAFALSLGLLLGATACGSNTSSQTTSSSAVSSETTAGSESAQPEEANAVPVRPSSSTGNLLKDAENAAKRLSFDTTDLDDSPVNDEILGDASLVMINFWEPWCGPCVQELPSLEKLYQTYKDQGLVILGVYTTFDMSSDAKDIVEHFSISYPILRCNQSLASCQTEYVPTTVFADAYGNLLSSEPYIGANSYEGWEEIVKSYLESLE